MKLVQILLSHFLSAWVFYILVVVLLENQKRRRVRRWLLSRYGEFKADLVRHYLSLLGQSYDRELVEKLENPRTFAAFFQEPFSSDQTRWHAVHNALYEWELPEIRQYCQSFVSDCDLAIGLSGELTDEAASVLRSVNLVSMRANLAEPDYDQIKSLLVVLFSLHCPWPILDGRVHDDLWKKRIERV